MYALFQLFFDICLLRKGPEDVPGTSRVIPFLLPVYAFINMLVLLLSYDFWSSVQQVTVEILLILSLPYCVLFLVGKPVRYQQTTSALIGTDCVITLASLPAMATLIGQGQPFAYFIIVVLMLWNWVVAGHIFTKALNQPLIFGLAVAFLYMVTTYQVLTWLFPEILAQA